MFTSKAKDEFGERANSCVREWLALCVCLCFNAVRDPRMQRRENVRVSVCVCVCVCVCVERSSQCRVAYGRKERGSLFFSSSPTASNKLLSGDLSLGLRRRVCQLAVYTAPRHAELRSPRHGRGKPVLVV